MTQLRFSARVEAALRELAGLPWEVLPGGNVRCGEVCPVCAVLNAERPDVDDPSTTTTWWWRAVYWLNWPIEEGRPVANAADERNHPLRPRLLELLGVSQ